MTTAPIENRGGNQNGPQNNPTMINPLGGNGQSGKGQPTMYIPGMKSLGSTGESTMAQQNGATIYREANNDTTGATPVPITAGTTLPNQSVLDGAPIGDGAMEVSGLPKPPTGDPDIDSIRAYYPVIQFWASQPGSSQGTKDYAAYLGTII
jgi:hypothetical protein